MSDLLKYLETKAPPFFIYYVCAFVAIIIISKFSYQLLASSSFGPSIDRHKNKILSFLYLNIVLLVIMGGYYLLFGYSKDFKLYVFDSNNKVIDDLVVFKNGLKIEPTNKIPINSKELYCSITVESKASTASVVIKADEFVSNNVIKLSLSDTSKYIELVKGEKGFKVFDRKYARSDTGGTDILIPHNRIKNSVEVIDNSILKENCFEIAVQSAFYDKHSSLSIDIGDSISVLLGEGGLNDICIKANKLHKSSSWVDVAKYPISEPVDVQEPFWLSVIVKKLNEKVVLSITVSKGRKMCRTNITDIENLSISEKKKISVGCISLNKSKKPKIRLMKVRVSRNNQIDINKSGS